MILRILIFISILIVIIWFRSGYERKQIMKSHYLVKSALVSKGFKIIMIADLHSKDYGDSNHKLMEMIRIEEPDVIMIAGDMFVGSRQDDCKVALSTLEKLSKIARVYYSLGNHEERTKDYIDELGISKYEYYMKEVKAFGVTVLDNEVGKIKIKGQDINVSGLTLGRKYFKKFQHELVKEEEIKGLLGEKEESVYHIMLAHNPVHLESYIKWGADLVLSGHLHGGIIRLPFLGGVITPQVKILPKYCAGMYEIGGKYGVISRGLGEHTVNLRFLNYPELSVITVESEK